MICQWRADELFGDAGGRSEENDELRHTDISQDIVCEPSSVSVLSFKMLYFFMNDR